MSDVTIPLRSHEEAIHVLGPYDRYAKLLRGALDIEIYAKNGNRPQLLEHLADLYPRHIQIHYGKYKREELYDAARHSRACAYLADDDHGPLALQEILLAGCPTVGVRTGTPFVQNEVTGFLVDRLPPGVQCCTNDDDKDCLQQFVQRIAQATTVDRFGTQLHAQRQFSTEKIAKRALEVLQSARGLH